MEKTVSIDKQESSLKGLLRKEGECKMKCVSYR